MHKGGVDACVDDQMGDVDVLWSYEVTNDEQTQTIGLWVNGTPLSEVRKDLGGDWSGPNGWRFS